MTRVLTALVGIPLVIYLIQYAPPVVCVVVIFLAMLLALHEYYALMQEHIPAVFRWLGYGVGAIVMATFYFQDMLPHFVALVPLLMLTAGLFSRLELAQVLSASAFSMFGALYIGGAMGFLTGLRMIEGGGEMGSDLLLLLFVIIWSGDSFAYFGGKAFGKHKLAPVISPKKTVEGAVFSFVFSIGFALAGRYLFIESISVMDAVLLGAIVGVAGQIGDLCESIIKRAMKRKDSGAILPGHGGMLDRVDSLLFGGPAMYYYFFFFLAPQ